MKSNYRKKTFRIGMYTTAITCVVLAIVIFINLIVSGLPSDKVKFDTTSEEIYTISEQTEKIVKGIDTDVTIYLIASETTYDTALYEFLERYRALNSHIKIELKNPVLYPDFSKEYTDENVSENSIIVVSGQSSRYIAYSSIYTTSYSSDYSSVEYTFNGESALTSAINYVTSDDLPMVYLLQGHGEAAFESYSSTITGYISDENITTGELSLLKTGSIPDDADAIIILDPTSDMSSDELNMLTDYISSGGRVMLISGSITSDMVNFTALANFCGLTPVEGIVAEGDDYYCYMYNTYLLPDYGYHTITEPFSNYYIMTPIAQGIRETDNTSNEVSGDDSSDDDASGDKASDDDASGDDASGDDASDDDVSDDDVSDDSSQAASDNNEVSVSVTGLLETSDKSYSKVDGSKMTTMEKEDKDIDGPFYVAAISEVSSVPKTGQFIYISSVYILDDSINQVTGGANNDFVMNCLEYMLDREDTISIRGKSMSADYLTVDDGTAFRLEFILIGVIPVALLVCGGIVCYRRKKEK